MYLKSLRLQGFKTFARRTELPFSRGITAIVGPNGSGKSNLVDAIRWALGERNARGLRGHRMEDVIYSGGPGKAAVGMADVTLTIDNADQRLNVEFTEIEVARRLFRSGESEYLINGTRARLKDIDALLASTGLRQDGYAVTAQNDIDFVIQAVPALRRELIEEAAGVRRLRDQRQEALNRLAEADRDMRRARDILNELSPRAEELRVQAVAADEYQKVADALKVLQGSLARDAWRKAMVQLRRTQARVHTAENKRAAMAQAVSEFEPRYAEHRSALLAAREARWRHQEAVADVRLRLAERQQQELRTQLEAWSIRQSTLTDELERRRGNVETADRELRDVDARAAIIEEGVGEADAGLDVARKAVVEHEAQLKAVEAELVALRTLLDHAHRRGPIKRGDNWERLLELIEVDPVNRAAVEAALEGWLHSWVARDRDGFESAATALSGAEDARETLLYGEELDPPLAVPGGFTAVVDLVRAPDQVARLVARLLRGAVLVADRTAGTRAVADHPELRAVTPAGEIITAVSYRGGMAADALLEVQARIRDAESALDRERQAALQAADEVERRATQRSALARERQTILARIDALRTATAQAAGALAAAGEAVQRETHQEAQLRQQLVRIGGLVEQAEQLQLAARSRQGTVAEAETATAHDLAQAEQGIHEASATMSTLVGRRQEAELRAALAHQRSDDLIRQLERAQQVLDSHGSELNQRRAAEGDLAVQPAIINEERRRWLEQAEILLAELASLEAAQLPDSASLTALEAQLREDEQANVALQVELAHADDACAAAAGEREAAQIEVERCASALRDGGQLVDDGEDAIEEVDWQKTEREVSRLQRRLDAMGAVNLLAPDEYAQVRERCEGLAGQLADLEAASAQLGALRERLEAEIDSRFRTVFQAVAVNFQEFFGELFEGGRATLRLETQPDGNPLDDGVEILAQTPGKRLQPLTLLSGGERALTALAFLFALQAVNPSPFYVLDEVDAALDDANVVRFNRVLKRLAADQQFLIVTHNHSTMAQAEVLYGVTLAEHGISRIVSVRLQQDALIPVAERTA